MDGQGPPGPPHMFGGPRGFDGPPDGDPFFDRPPFDQPPRGYDDSGFHGPRRGDGGPPRGGRGGRFGWRGGPPRGMPPGVGGPPPHLIDEEQQQPHTPPKRMRMEEKPPGNSNNIISNINSSTTGKSEESSEKEIKVERSRRSRWSNASPEQLQDIAPVPEPVPLSAVEAPAVELKPEPPTETCPPLKEEIIAASEPEPESSEVIKSEC